MLTVLVSSPSSSAAVTSQKPCRKRVYLSLCAVGVSVATGVLTRCSAIAERPRCRVHYSFRRKCRTATGRQYFTYYRSILNHCDIIGLKICRIQLKNAKYGLLCRGYLSSRWNPKKTARTRWTKFGLNVARRLHYPMVKENSYYVELHLRLRQTSAAIGIVR